MKYNYLLLDTHTDSVEAGSLAEAAIKVSMCLNSVAKSLDMPEIVDVTVVQREDTLEVKDQNGMCVLHVAPAV